MRHGLLRIVRKPEWFAAVVLAVGLGLVLFHAPRVGLANNGDFDRLMAMFGLHYPTRDSYFYLRYDRYFVRAFVTGALSHGFYPSSAVLPIGLAWLINLLIHPGIFDTDVLALIYIMGLTYGAFWIVRGLRQALSLVSAWTAALFGLLIFTEIGYAAYLPSLYSEPASWVFWVLMLGLFFRLLVHPGARWAKSLFWIAATAFLMAKVQNAPLIPAIWIGAWGVYETQPWRGDWWWYLRIAAILLLFVFLVILLNPPSFDAQNTYDSFFTGVIAVASPQDHVLQWFHLGTQWIALRGHPYFSPQSLRRQARLISSGFYRKVTLPGIAWFYVTHPWDLWKGLQLSQAAALQMRPSYLGNFEWIARRGAGAWARRADAWRYVRLVLPVNPGFWLALWTVYIGQAARVLARTANRLQRGVAWLSLLIIASTILQFVIPFVAEGENELVKHLFLYNILFDTVLMVIAIWLANSLQTWLPQMFGHLRPASSLFKRAHRR